MCGIKSCQLFNNVEIPYTGNKEADIVWVYDSPTYEEVFHRPPKPFIGDTFLLAKQFIAHSGLFWTDLFHMHSARCLINKKELSDREITTILKKCRCHVELVLKKLQPKLIIMAGELALRQILNRKGLAKARHEHFIWSDEFNCWCKATYSPEYLKRYSNYNKEALKDMSDIKFFIKNNFNPPEQNISVDYKVVDDITDYINENSRIAIDTEGQGLTWEDENYITIGYSISVKPNSGRYIQLYEISEHETPLKTKAPIKKGNKTKTTEIYVKEAKNFKLKIEQLLDLLENPNIKKIMQNGNFDIHCFNTLFTRVLGRKPKIQQYTFDTQACAHVLDENKYNLADLVTLQNSFTNRRDNYDLEFSKKYKKDNMLSVPIEDMVTYACPDADITLQVAMEQAKNLVKYPKLANYFTKFVMPTLNTLRVIEEHGVLMDVDNMPKIRTQLYTEMMESQQKALSLVPKKIIDLHFEKNSQKKDGILLTRDAFIRDILFHKDGFKLKPINFTATKLPSVSAHDIKEIKNKTKSKKVIDFLTYFESFKKRKKIISTNIDGFKKHLTKNNKVHSRLSINRTVTGRIASSQPNIMNFPKRDVLAQYFRKLIIPPKGWLIFAIDQSQAELRWMAHCANEPEMIRIYNSDSADLHTETGKLMAVHEGNWDSLPKSKQKEYRQKAKCQNFGLLYGMSAYGFMKYAKKDYNLNLTLAQAEQWRNNFFRKYRRLLPFHRETIEFCKKYGYVESPLGRRRRLPSIRSDNEGERKHAENEAVNHPIQSPSSDTVLIACNQLLGNRPLNPATINNASMQEILRKLNFNDKKDYGFLNPDECYPFMFIHDELVFAIKDNSKAIDYMKIIKYEMENPPLERDFGVKLKVPLVAEGKYSNKSLNDLKDIDL